MGVPMSDIMATPPKDKIIPKTILLVICSLRNIAAKITTKTGIVAMMRLAAPGLMNCSP